MERKDQIDVIFKSASLVGGIILFFFGIYQYKEENEKDRLQQAIQDSSISIRFLEYQNSRIEKDRDFDLRRLEILKNDSFQIKSLNLQQDAIANDLKKIALEYDLKARYEYSKSEIDSQLKYINDLYDFIVQLSKSENEILYLIKNSQPNSSEYLLYNIPKLNEIINKNQVRYFEIMKYTSKNIDLKYIDRYKEVLENAGLYTSVYFKTHVFIKLAKSYLETKEELSSSLLADWKKEMILSTGGDTNYIGESYHSIEYYDSLVNKLSLYGNLISKEIRDDRTPLMDGAVFEMYRNYGIVELTNENYISIQYDLMTLNSIQNNIRKTSLKTIKSRLLNEYLQGDKHFDSTWDELNRLCQRNSSFLEYAMMNFRFNSLFIISEFENSRKKIHN